MTALRSTVRRTSQTILDVVFPPRCAGCGHRGVWVCDPCAATSARIEPPLCDRCGADAGTACLCRRLSSALDMARSALIFEGWVRPAVSFFKYEGERARAPHLAALLVPLAAALPRPVALVPVPLHIARERRRGYNQAELLAREAGSNSGLAVECVLRKTAATKQQMGLSAEERAINVRGAFAATDSATVAGRRFVLVDDVMTTGATLGACALALKEAGADWVGAITVARER